MEGILIILVNISNCKQNISQVFTHVCTLPIGCCRGSLAICFAALVTPLGAIPGVICGVGVRLEHLRRQGLRALHGRGSGLLCCILPCALRHLLVFVLA